MNSDANVNWVSLLPNEIPYGREFQRLSTQDLHLIKCSKGIKPVKRYSAIVSLENRKNVPYYWTSLSQLWDFWKSYIPKVVGRGIKGEILIVCIWNETSEEDRITIIDSVCTSRAVDKLETFFKEELVMCEKNSRLPKLRELRFILISKKSK